MTSCADSFEKSHQRRDEFFVAHIAYDQQLSEKTQSLSEKL